MKKDARLNEKQIAILKDMFTRQLNGENMEAIAISHGISRKTLSTWKNTDHGKQLHAEFQRELSRESMPTFYRVLDEKVASGNLKAMELYAKVHGILSPERKEIVNKYSERDIVNDGLSNEMLSELKSLIDEEEPTLRRVK